MKKVLFILFILIAKYGSAQDGHSVSGTITDDKNTPIDQVSVFIPEFQKYCVTDSKGAYQLTNVGSGTVTIQFSRPGYKTVLKTINTSEASYAVDAKMETTSMELEEVLVTSNYAKLTDNIPFSANSVSQQEMQKYSSPSVMGNLSYQPGIDRISIGNGIGKPVIRGLSFNQIMLYAQGTRIENQQWDDHHDLGLSDVGIDNVEVVRGPAALIYGADALGGALIFTDEKPAAAGSFLGDANVGFASNTLGFLGDVGVKGANAKGLFYGVRAGTQNHTSYLQGEDEDEVKKPGEEEEEFAANSKMSNITGKANVGISKKWGVSKLSYSFFNQQIGIIEDESGDTLPKAKSEEEEQREREMEAPYQDVTTQIVSLENTILTGKSKLNVNFAYQLNDRKEYEPNLPVSKKELAIGLMLNTTTYDVKWTSNAEKNLGFIIGSQGTFLKNKNNGMESLVPDADVSDVAGYGLVRYDKGKLNLLGGVRYDARRIEAESFEENEGMEEDTFIVHHAGGTIDTVMKPEVDFEKEYAPVSFSIGAAYHLNKAFTLKVNGATGFSAPNYAQLGTFGKHEGTFRFERGDKTLNMEQNMEGDLGLMWESDFITISAAGYTNMVKDYIYIVNTGDTMVRITPHGIDTLPIYDYKQGDATLSGGEFGFDIHPRAAKWLDIKATYAVISGTLDAGGNLPYIPSNKLIGELKLSKEKLAMFSNTYFTTIVSNYAKQNNVTEYELSSEGYTLLDVHIGADFKIGRQKPSFDIYCTNVLNTGYFNQLSLVKYIGVHDMGRNIGFRLRLPFGT